MIHHAAAALLIGVMAGYLSHDLVGMSPAPRKGFAAYYQKPGLMESIARKRGLDVAHPVASPYEPIGRRLRVCSQRGCINAVVADVCHPRHCASIRRRGLVVELSYRDNGRICGHYNEPPRKCVVSVSRN